MQNKPNVVINSRDVVIILVALLAVAFVVWMRNDLGREVTWGVIAVCAGIGLTLAIISITGVGFRLAQRSDNVEVGWLGVYRGMVEANAAERRAQIEELKLYNQQMLVQAQKPQALPMFDDDDDDDEPFFVAVESTDAAGWVGGGR